MTGGASSNQRQDDVVILLPLVLVHSGDLGRGTEDGVVGAALGNDVADEMLLPFVWRDDGDGGRGVPHEAHVHVELHCVLGLAQILVEERRRTGLAVTVKIANVDELELHKHK